MGEMNDMVITKQTTFTPSAHSFDYKSLDNNIQIATLSQVTSNQLVPIKEYVTNMSATKTVVLQESQVKKQECYIVDPTGSIKLVLWGSHTNTLEEHSTYFFNRVRVKVTKDQRYLNTPKNDTECTIEPAEPFPEQLPTVEVLSTIKEVVADIIGVSNIAKTQCCCSCHKKVIIKGTLAFCQNCSMTQKVNHCKIQWYLRLLVETTQDPHQNLRLAVFSDVANKLKNLCDLEHSASEQELTEAILDLGTLTLAYDIQTHKLIDVELLTV